MTAPAPTRPAKLRIAYPRPPLTRDHGVLFREPAYEDGQPYREDDDLEDDQPDT
jgi:hypothetical protein